MLSDQKPTQRFSHTVENYVKYRPSYPIKILEILKKHYGFSDKTVVADIGSGTGIFTELLLDHGNIVFGVEPNAEMRQAAEHFLSQYKNFTSVGAASEATTLPDHSVDLITVAQAFHWFDQSKVKKEFARILKRDGWLVLLWNLRVEKNSGIMQAYEQLLRKFGINYEQVCAESFDEQTLHDFFAPHRIEVFNVPHTQLLDWEAFKGRLLSMSYVPKVGDPNFDAMCAVAERAFEAHAVEGRVLFEYEAKVYVGRFG